VKESPGTVKGVVVVNFPRQNSVAGEGRSKQSVPKKRRRGGKDVRSAVDTSSASITHQ